MTDPSLFRLRVRFSKAGRCVLLSHLELARALERAVRRARLPFAVSQGFSPHMKIAFGAALPLGVGGLDECFDLLLTRYVAPEKALEALKAASVGDLMPTACSYIGPRDAAASVAYPISSYQAHIGNLPVESLSVPEEIRVLRKKKEKILRVSDYLCGPLRSNTELVETALGGVSEVQDLQTLTEVVFELEAKPTGSLRPDLFLQACLEKTCERALEAAETAESDENDPSATPQHKGQPRILSITRISQRAV